MSATRATLHSERDKLAQVEKVVREVIDNRRAGLQVDYSAIERRHADLLPHLSERLRRLQMIEAAARQAKQQPESAGSTDQRRLAFDEDLGFLREALTGYEILERVHYGGQGIVYKAIQRSTKRTVAVKLLLDGPLATERQRHRFAREVELVSRLRHPNIVTLYESGDVRGRPFFAMEFVDGLPIDDYVLLNGLGVRETVMLFQIVCQAVSTAHQQGIIHRDLKPTNIVVDAQGQPHVLDFGLAKEIAHLCTGDARTSVSVAGQIVGTLPYLSPEQADGAGDEVDVRSDIYTLAVVLFELLTGCSPYPVEGDRETVRNNILYHKPVSLRKLLSHADTGTPPGSRHANDDLEKIVLKALEKDKSRRYQSAAALADDLGCYLVGDAVEAKAASTSYLLRKTLRKFRVHVAIAATFGALLVAALIGVTAAWQRADRIGRIAQAGLQMGSFLKLGGVHRDAGRLDQAEAMFEKAAEIGDYVATSDPFVLRHVYDAHHRLAELYFETGRTEKAVPHSEAAVDLAQDLARNDASNHEWRRLLGFSYTLRGRMALSQNEWERALDNFDHAASIYKDLISVDPNNSSLTSDFGLALNWEALCFRKLKRYDEALHHCTAAHAIFKELAEAEPDIINHIIELSRTEAKLGVWHLSQRTAQHDEIAAEWLKRAEDRLVALRDSGRADARDWDVQTLLDNTHMNKQVILKRVKERGGTPD